VAVLSIEGHTAPRIEAPKTPEIETPKVSREENRRRHPFPQPAFLA